MHLCQYTTHIRRIYIHTYTQHFCSQSLPLFLPPVSLSLSVLIYPIFPLQQKKGFEKIDNFWDIWRLVEGLKAILRLAIFHFIPIWEFLLSCVAPLQNFKNRMAHPLPPPLPSQKGITQTKSEFRPSSSASSAMNHSLDCLFDEAYRADVSILMDYDNIIYAHTSILGAASPVLRAMLKQLRGRGRRRQRVISIHGVPPEAVRVFVRFLYSSCYEEEKMEEFALPLLVLSHSFVVPQLKLLCELWLERKSMNVENVIDSFQLSLLCDAPRLSLICHRFILRNLKPVSATEGWRIMKESHPNLEKEIIESAIYEDVAKKQRTRKVNETKVYLQLYEAMEALVHICKDGCRTIGPHDKILKGDQAPCKYEACKGLEMLIRHFARCKMRGPGGSCIHCKRMWQILELHSRLCADSNVCRVPLCRNFREKRRKQNKKEDIRWRILVRKIVRSRSISGAPYFTLGST